MADPSPALPFHALLKPGQMPKVPVAASRLPRKRLLVCLIYLVCSVRAVRYLHDSWPQSFVVSNSALLSIVIGGPRHSGSFTPNAKSRQSGVHQSQPFRFRRQIILNAEPSARPERDTDGRFCHSIRGNSRLTMAASSTSACSYAHSRWIRLASWINSFQYARVSL